MAMFIKNAGTWIAQVQENVTLRTASLKTPTQLYIKHNGIWKEVWGTYVPPPPPEPAANVAWGNVDFSALPGEDRNKSSYSGPVTLNADFQLNALDPNPPSEAPPTEPPPDESPMPVVQVAKVAQGSIDFFVSSVEGPNKSSYSGPINGNENFSLAT